MIISLFTSLLMNAIYVENPCRIQRYRIPNIISGVHNLFIIFALGSYFCGVNIPLFFIQEVSLGYFFMDLLWSLFIRRDWIMVLHHMLSMVLLSHYFHLELIRWTFLWIEIGNWPIYLTYDFYQLLQDPNQKHHRNIDLYIQDILTYQHLLAMELIVFGSVRMALGMYYLVWNPVQDLFLYWSFSMIWLASIAWFCKLYHRYTTLSIRIHHTMSQRYNNDVNSDDD